VLDKHLKGRVFIVGRIICIADISEWGGRSGTARIPGGWRIPLAAFPNLQRCPAIVRDQQCKSCGSEKDHRF